jgi:predicted nucleic acid-binding protein
VARKIGIRLTELLGILLEAKHRGLVSKIAIELDRLKTKTSFRISPEVRQEVLLLAGESQRHATSSGATKMPVYLNPANL